MKVARVNGFVQPIRLLVQAAEWIMHTQNPTADETKKLTVFVRLETYDSRVPTDTM